MVPSVLSTSTRIALENLERRQFRSRTIFAHDVSPPPSSHAPVAGSAKIPEILKTSPLAGGDL